MDQDKPSADTPDPLSITQFVRRSFVFDMREHITAFAGVVVTFYIALRFTAVANWDTQTAAGILQALGPGDAIVGTLIQGIPAVIAAACSIVLGWNTYALVRFGWQPPLGPEHFLESVVLVLILVLIPVSLLIAPVLLCVAVSIPLALADKKTPTALETARSRRVIYCIALSVVGVRFLMDSTMWLPVESIDPADHTNALTGYILEVSGDTITVLRRDTREIAFLPSAGLKHSLCGNSKWLSRPAIALVSKNEWPSYAKCPSG